MVPGKVSGLSETVLMELGQLWETSHNEKNILQSYINSLSPCLMDGCLMQIIVLAGVCCCLSCDCLTMPAIVLPKQLGHPAIDCLLSLFTSVHCTQSTAFPRHDSPPMCQSPKEYAQVEVPGRRHGSLE